MAESEHGLELFEKIKEANTSNKKDMEKLLKAVGYSKGEIEEFLGNKIKIGKRDRLEEIKDEIYIRHKLRIRLMQEHLRESNLLVTLDACRQEESHLIDSLTKLGDIAPVQSGNNVQALLGIEQFIYSAYKQDNKEVPQLLEALPNEPGQEDTESSGSDSVS